MFDLLTVLSSRDADRKSDTQASGINPCNSSNFGKSLKDKHWRKKPLQGMVAQKPDVHTESERRSRFLVPLPTRFNSKCSDVKPKTQATGGKHKENVWRHWQGKEFL